jgi:hypothetical protein
MMYPILNSRDVANTTLVNPSPTPSICSKTKSHIENLIVPIGKFAGLLCTFHRNNRRCDLCCRDDRENHNVEKNPKVSFIYPLPPTHCYPEMVSMVGVIGLTKFANILEIKKRCGWNCLLLWLCSIVYSCYQLR